MRAGDKDRLGAIRMLLAAIKQREVDERSETTDTHVLQIVEKLIKQRREAASQFAAGARPDLEHKELAEIAVLEPYLPAALSPAEVEALVDSAMQETGATAMKDMGRVMALLRDRAQGRVDFARLSALVKGRLSGH